MFFTVLTNQLASTNRHCYQFLQTPWISSAQNFKAYWIDNNQLITQGCPKIIPIDMVLVSLRDVMSAHA